MQVQESGATIQKMLQFMKDAMFLDDRSRALRGIFVTYNHPRETFCTVELQLSQGRNGAFHGRVLLFRHVLSPLPCITSQQKNLRRNREWPCFQPACQHHQ
jgi:hypothetical protein